MSRATFLWLVLALLSGGFAANTGLRLRADPAETSLAATPPPAAAAPQAPPPAAPLPALSRPLFVGEAAAPSTRKPPPSSTPAAKAKPTLRLAGVIIDGERKLALIEAKSDQPPVRVGEGGALGPWRIVRVERRKALLRGPDGDLLLRLDPEREQPEPAR